MKTAFTDWRTTLPGLVSSAALFVAFSAGKLHFPTWVTVLAAFVGAGGLANLGINARSQGQHDIDAQALATSQGRTFLPSEPAPPAAK